MSENPYEPPTSQADLPTPQRRSWSKTLGFFFVLIAVLPASGIACFGICFAVVEGAPRARNDPYGFWSLMMGLSIGITIGAVVFGLMVWWAISLSRESVERPRIWTKSDGSRLEALFISSDEKEVALRNVDGTDLRVPLERLSVVDRVWLEARGHRQYP